MESHYNKKSYQVRHAASCEIIQEIFALGANCLLRENEEELFQRLLSKYQRHNYDPSVRDGGAVPNDEDSLELLIRRTLLRRKTELALGTHNPPRKKVFLSVAAAASSGGSVGKAAEDSAQASGRIRRA